MRKCLKLPVVLMAVAMSLMGTALAVPVLLTVTPSAVSNTYPGVISLDITGLTNTETVIIRKWLDGNGNGLVDPGEWMVD
ncbi:MAG TPA: hypothetical protein VH280_21300, partial [Verrucomicrobiae bacterium]|nr:hypothetical protein [Verrucomicrobiae bacterium]